MSAFSGGSDARLLISAAEQYIITDGRYLEQVNRECPQWELVRTNGAGLDSLASICDKYNSLLVESSHITYELYSQLAANFKTAFGSHSQCHREISSGERRTGAGLAQTGGRDRRYSFYPHLPGDTGRSK